MADKAGPQGAASALLNGLRVLEAFTPSEPSLGVSDIAARVGLHKSTASRILSGLADEGYVQRDPATNLYSLGLGVIRLAASLLADLDIRRAADPELRRLTAQVRETSALTVWNQVEAIVVEQIPGPQGVKHTASIGTRYNRLESSSVRVFMADLPEAEAAALVQSGQVTDSRNLTPAEVVEELASVRAAGYAVNDGRTDPLELGISAPVRDFRDRVIGCVTLAAPRTRVAAEALPGHVAAVLEAAARVQAVLGG